MKRESYLPLDVLKNLPMSGKEARDFLVNSVLDARDNGLSERQINQMMNSPQYMSVMTILALRGFEKNKQVYKFDENFLEILSTCDLDLPIDKALFKNLPFDTFFVQLEGELNGDDLFGVVQLNEELNIFYVGLFEGSVINHTVFPLLEIGKDTGANIADGIERFRMDEVSKRRVSLVFQAAIYLSAQNAVITENPKQKKIYKPPFDQPKNRYSEVRMWDCGIRYTKDQTKAIVRDAKEFPSNRLRRSPRPHWKHAHYQHYWTGPKDNKKLILKWKAPYMVGQGETPAVVHIKEKL